MINKQQRTTLTRAINRVIQAELAHSWKGAGHPDDYPIIEQQLKDARKRLKMVMDGLMLADTIEGRRRQITNLTE